MTPARVASTGTGVPRTVSVLEYRATNLEYPLAWRTRRPPVTPVPVAPPQAEAEPSRLVTMAILIQLGASSVVMVEPALCDILFPPVFALTIYLLLYVVFLAGFLGKFGEPGMRVVRDGYQIAAVIAAGIGILASLHVLPNSQIFFRDASMVRVQSTFKDPNVFAPFLVAVRTWQRPWQETTCGSAD